jgi:hypothetical protein
MKSRGTGWLILVMLLAIGASAMLIGGRNETSLRVSMGLIALNAVVCIIGY